MNTVYLDILFFINFLTDYITLLSTAKICGTAIKRHKFAAASLLGAVYAVLCTYFNSTWIDHSLLKCAAAILICLISFNRETHLFRCIVTFILVSAVFGGLLSAFVIKDSNPKLIPIDARSLTIVFVMVYIILSIYYRNVGSRVARTFHKAEITFREKSLSLTVLQDTGNELSDPISNLPVMIIEKNILSSIIPELNCYSDETDIYNYYCLLSQSDSLRGKLRLIPYQSISEKGTLLGVIPDHISIDGHTAEMIVAYSDHQFNESNQYQGIY